MTGTRQKKHAMKKFISHSLVVAVPVLIPGLAIAQTPAEPAPPAPAPAIPPNAEPAPDAPQATEIPTPEQEAAPQVEPAPEPEPAPTPVVVAVVPVPAAEEKPPEPSLSPIKFGTSTWSRFELRENYDKLGVSRGRFSEGDQTVFRARIKMETAELPLIDGLTGLVNFTPQASGSFGLSGTGGTIGEANLGIYEGFFMLKSKSFEMKGGRFAMNYGDSLVIGNLDWHQTARAFDGLHTHLILDKGYIDAFITQQAEGSPAVSSPFAAGDSYFWGLYSNFGGYIAKDLNLEPYFLGLSSAATDNIATTDGAGNPITYARDGATLFTLGARIQQKLTGIDYRIEGGFQFGESPGAVPPSDDRAEAVTTIAGQVEGEFGIAIGPKARVGLGGFYATGNDPSSANNEAYNELFPTTHKFLGWMDVIGLRTNVAGGMLKFGLKITDALTADVHGHLFARPQAGGLGRVMGAADGFAGGEVNVQLLQKIGKFMSVRPMYGLFIPNANHYATGDLVHYFELQGGVNF